MSDIIKVMPSTSEYFNVIKELASIPADLHYIFLSNTIEALIQSEANIVAWRSIGCKIKQRREALVALYKFPPVALGWDVKYLDIRIAIEKLRKRNKEGFKDTS